MTGTEFGAVARFRWPVAGGGYKVLAGDSLAPLLRPHVSGGWALVEARAGREGRLTDPLSDPALYANFAGVDVADPGRVAAFASRHGPLLGLHPVEYRSIAGAPQVALIEHGAVWQANVVLMRLAVDLWRLAAANDAAALDRFVRRLPGEDGGADHWAVSTDHGVDRFAADRPPGYVFEWLYPAAEAHPSGPAEPMTADVTLNRAWVAKLWVRNTANRVLARHTHPQWGLAEKTREETFGLVPKTLLGCLWLQLVRGLMGNRELAVCQAPGCQRLYDPSPEGRGGWARFCSDACKSRNRRANLKVKARDRAAEEEPDAANPPPARKHKK